MVGGKTGENVTQLEDKMLGDLKIYKFTANAALLYEINVFNKELCETDDYGVAMAVTKAIKSLCRVLLTMDGEAKQSVAARLREIAENKPKKTIAGIPAMPYEALEKTAQLVSVSRNIPSNLDQFDRVFKQGLFGLEV